MLKPASQALLAALFGLLVLARPSAGTAGDDETTVCALAAHPEHYSSQMVEVRAQVTSTSTGLLLLYDSACVRTPIALNIPHEIRQRADVYPLWRAIFREGGHLGTINKYIVATLSGQFMTAEGGGFLQNGMLTLHSVRHIYIKID